jgi:hypothetical protein
VVASIHAGSLSAEETVSSVRRMQRCSAQDRVVEWRESADVTTAARDFACAVNNSSDWKRDNDSAKELGNTTRGKVALCGLDLRTMKGLLLLPDVWIRKGTEWS